MRESESANSIPIGLSRDAMTPRLTEVRARLSELRRRIETERAPKAIIELVVEAGRLIDLLSELNRPAEGDVDSTTNTGDVGWPTDLSTGQADESEWGADPEEVARG